MEEKSWQPHVRLRDEDIVPISVAYSEKAVRDKLKTAGGKWDPEVKLWLVPYAAVRGTELEERILVDFIKGRRGG